MSAPSSAATGQPNDSNEPGPAQNGASRAATESTASTIAPPPRINLPKSGALRGIGETFTTSPTGAGTLTVPIQTSPARSEFEPQLTLSYDSGSGNGPFGIGWQLSLPSITRRTDRGLPQYLDASESDVFVLSGAEDLVPVLNEDLTRFEDTTSAPGYTIHRFRPRVEGLFARIERWTRADGQDCYWRSISRDNITSWFGRTSESRIADPDDDTKIFTWFICSSYDDRGNAIVYVYQPEDARGVDTDQAHERNRGDGARLTNRYIKRIRYGNQAPNRDMASWLAIDPATLPPEDFHFEVVFDYDEDHVVDIALSSALTAVAQHRYVSASPASRKDWGVRPDAHSEHRACFEVRSYRRVHRALTFHRFAQLGTTPCLVRSTEFDYDDFDYSAPYTAQQEAAHNGSTRMCSVITRITQHGFVQAPIGGQPDRYLRKSYPPLEIEYSTAVIDSACRAVMGTENLPEGVDGTVYRWVDLDSEGLSGALAEQAGHWSYKRNVSALPMRDASGALQVVARFEPSEDLMSAPMLAGASAAVYEFLDLEGDGHVDVVELHGAAPGFFERTPDGDWQPQQQFWSLPSIDWTDPNLRFIDVTGDGLADVVITEDAAFRWYPSLGEEGFAPAQRVDYQPHEDKGPRLIFADETQTVFLADMTGDGLTDLVRIRDHDVSYWPSVGRCVWGPRVAMDDPPWFDAVPFDPKRLRLADIDGSGTTDMIYLGATQIDIYRNQAGNRWSKGESITSFPEINDRVSVNALDLLGNSTACLVWSSPFAKDADAPMQYIDLMGGSKPHLLTRIINNLGSETCITYAPSTKFYLDDRANGRPWITKLPFPIHVVERVETYDWVSGNRAVSTYAYRHGHYNREREAAGFGMVEQRDTQQFRDLVHGSVFPTGTNVEEQSHVPPVLTRTWYHTGADLDGQQVSRALALEYFGAPPPTDTNFEDAWRAFEATLLDDTILPDLVGSAEWFEACRALKGSMLRQEVYARDGSAAEDIPYVITEQSFALLRLQQKGGNRHSVFFVHPRETLTSRCERNALDPRIEHALTLTVDPQYGLPTKTLSVAYGRAPGFSGLAGEDLVRQEQLLATYTESDYTPALDNAAAHPDDHRTPLPSEARTYEITGLVADATIGRVRFDDVSSSDAAALRNLTEVSYESPASPTASRKRLIERTRTLYRADGLGGLLPVNTVQPLALPGREYRLAFTPGLAQSLYVDSGNLTQAQLNAVLATDGRYVDLDGDGHSWQLSSEVFYSTGTNDDAATELVEARTHFYLPRRFRDPFHRTDGTWSTETFVDYDEYDLLLRETRDALDNCVTAGERRFTLPNGTVLPATNGNDYRALQPRLVMDPNRNRAVVAFDALGLVTGRAVMGKPEDSPALGDRIDAAFAADLTDADVGGVYDSPDPRAPATSLLRDATARTISDLNRFWRTRLANPGDSSKWEPSFTLTVTRETHVSEAPGGRVQLDCSYSDGSGREVQHKVLTEAGVVPTRDAAGHIVVGSNGQPVMTTASVAPRWIASGWVLRNNKQQPVRKFESFFSDTHRPDFDVRIGVSPILFYDPLGRVVVTLYPNNSYQKVVFDAWQQTTYDVNDTSAARNAQTGDPRTDPDIAGYVARYFTALPAAAAAVWTTWYAQRAAGWLGADEQTAALRTAAHSDTPTTVYLDVLGRQFLTLVRNRVVCSTHPLNGDEDVFAARVGLDIEGNQRWVRDSVAEAGDVRGRIVARFSYDMLGGRVFEESMEAGARWMLADVSGTPLHEWHSRGHHFENEYDELRRRVRRWVTGTTAESDARTLGASLLIELTEFGEAQPQPETLNLRGRTYRRSDSAGVVTNAAPTPAGALQAYDFKGNLLRAQRQFPLDHTAVPDWSGAVAPDPELFTWSTRYDAVNRAVQTVQPRPTTRASVHVTQNVFNEAGMLTAIHVWLARAGEPTGLIDPAIELPSTVGVSQIERDAKGQRAFVDLVTNGPVGLRTRYTYDPLTSRLTHLQTTRTGSAFNLTDRPGDVQNLTYAYDAAGNVTHIEDAAQQTIYFANVMVQPSNDYTYDAVYRLIQATGREHLGQLNTAVPHSYNDSECVGFLFADAAGRFAPNDDGAMARYCEKYVYDEVGNLQLVSHHSTCNAGPSWRRTYTYAETSQIEDGTGGTLTKMSNRLTDTRVGNNTLVPESYAYDSHGNMTQMPHLDAIDWDYDDRLLMTRRQRINQSDVEGGQVDGEQTWYVYDSSGHRVRKVTELAGGGVKDERIYLDGIEFYRRRSGPSAGLERETLHVMDGTTRVAIVERRNAVDDGSPLQLIRYQFGNHLGSVALELDDAAQIISFEEYSPYGSTKYQAMRSSTEAPNRFRYSARERDAESGFFHHGARYMSPWLGRWISCDPGGLVDGLNLYAYCRGNPVRLVDRTGTQGGPPGQMFFYEYRRVFGQKVTATRSGRGFTQRIRANAQKIYEMWGGQGKADIAHVEKPQALLRAGESTTVVPQEPAVNRAYAATEKKMVEAAREKGEFARESGVDTEAPSGKRYNKSTAADDPDAFKSEEFKTWEKTEAPKVEGPSGEPSGPKASGPKPEQLELPFEKGLSKASAPVEAAPAVAAPEPVTAAPKPVVEPVSAPAAPRGGVRAKLGRVAGAAGSVAGVILLGAAVKQTVEQISAGDYTGAAITTGTTALSFTVAAPLVVAGGVIAKYYTDPSIEARSFAVGDKVAEATGSTILGATASAASAVGISVYETGKDVVNSGVDFVKWGFNKLF